MVPTYFTGLRVLPSVLLGKNPLPSPFGRSIRILAIQRTRQEYFSPTLSKIFIVNAFDLFQMVGERLFQDSGNIVIRSLPLAIANRIS